MDDRLHKTFYVEDTLSDYFLFLISNSVSSFFFILAHFYLVQTYYFDQRTETKQRKKGKKRNLPKHRMVGRIFSCFEFYVYCLIMPSFNFRRSIYPLSFIIIA